MSSESERATVAATYSLRTLIEMIKASRGCLDGCVNGCDGCVEMVCDDQPPSPVYQSRVERDDVVIDRLRKALDASEKARAVLEDAATVNTEKLTQMITKYNVIAAKHVDYTEQFHAHGHLLDVINDLRDRLQFNDAFAKDAIRDVHASYKKVSCTVETQTDFAEVVEDDVITLPVPMAAEVVVLAEAEAVAVADAEAKLSTIKAILAYLADRLRKINSIKAICNTTATRTRRGIKRVLYNPEVVELENRKLKYELEEKKCEARIKRVRTESIQSPTFL
jgi:hypothetical protein